MRTYILILAATVFVSALPAPAATYTNDFNSGPGDLVPFVSTGAEALWTIDTNGPRGQIAENTTEGRYRITRVGNVIAGSLDNGGGTFFDIYSGPAFTADVVVKAYAFQSANSGQRSSTSLDIIFDDLQITAEDFAPIPEPATMGLLALGGLALIRRRRDGSNSFKTGNRPVHVDKP